MKFESFATRPEVHPSIYAYIDTNPMYQGYIKVGYTERDIDKRVSEQYNILKPGDKLPYDIILRESAMRNDGSSFTDKDVHKVLEKKGFKALKDKQGKKTEFFECKLDDVRAASATSMKKAAPMTSPAGIDENTLGRVMNISPGPAFCRPSSPRRRSCSRAARPACRPCTSR